MLIQKSSHSFDNQTAHPSFPFISLFQVDLLSMHLIDGIITRGRQDANEWVTLFQIGKELFISVLKVYPLFEHTIPMSHDTKCNFTGTVNVVLSTSCFEKTDALTKV